MYSTCATGAKIWPLQIINHRGMFGGLYTEGGFVASITPASPPPLLLSSAWPDTHGGTAGNTEFT